MKNKWKIVTGAALVLAAGFVYLKSDTGAGILQKIQNTGQPGEGMTVLSDSGLNLNSVSVTGAELTGEELTAGERTGELSAASPEGTDMESISQGDALETGVPGAGTGGFTEQQKAELEAIVAEALEEKLTSALAENLNAMLEDGRLTTAVENYAEVQSSLININTADETELTGLTGIGEARAKAIVAYRTEHGNFRSLEELTNISGISTGILEKFRDQATL